MLYSDINDIDISRYKNYHYFNILIYLHYFNFICNYKVQRNMRWTLVQQ